MSRHEIPAQPIVELKGISVVAPESGKTILHETTYDIPSENFTLILGRSGAGKSTLLDVISGRLQPTTGRINHLAEDGTVAFQYASENESTVPRQNRLARLMNGARNLLFLETREEAAQARYGSDETGFIAQEPHLPRQLKAWQYLDYTLGMRDAKVDPQYLAKLIENLEIEDQMNQYPRQMSGGERQRVALAYALANKPRLLLVDEPTSSMDSVSADIIMNQLRTSVDEGASVIGVSHDSSHTKYADNIIDIVDGVSQLRNN